MSKQFKSPIDQANEMNNESTYFGDSPLWTAAASGNKKYLTDYYTKGGKPNQKFNGFGQDHSLIMAAARNQLPEIVKMLEGYGEKTLSPSEANELSLLKNQWGWETGDDYQPTETVDPKYDWKGGGYRSFDDYALHTNLLNDIGRAIHSRTKELDTNDIGYRNKKVKLDDWLNNQKAIYDKYQKIIEEKYNAMKKVGR